MVYIVHSLNYCCVEYYYARATHALHMSYEVVTIAVRKNYITLQLRYDTIRNLFFDSYRTYVVQRMLPDYFIHYAIRDVLCNTYTCMNNSTMIFSALIILFISL